MKIKTPYGDTDQFKINNTVMQGTIFAGRKCTTQLDKLGKNAYHERKSLFSYKNTVRVTPLELVDDIAIATICNIDKKMIKCAKEKYLRNTITNDGSNKTHVIEYLKDLELYQIYFQ